MMMISLQEKPNMASRAACSLCRAYSAAGSAADGVVLPDAAFDGRPGMGMINALAPLIFPALTFLEASLEGGDPLAEVAHDPRQLPPTAEEYHDDGKKKY